MLSCIPNFTTDIFARLQQLRRDIAKRFSPAPFRGYRSPFTRGCTIVLTSLQIDPFDVNQQFEIVPLMADDLLVVVNFQWQAVLPLTLWCKRPPLREICKHNEAINDCADEENEKQEGNGDEEASLKCSLGESEEQASPEWVVRPKIMERRPTPKQRCPPDTTGTFDGVTRDLFAPIVQESRATLLQKGHENMFIKTHGKCNGTTLSEKKDLGKIILSYLYLGSGALLEFNFIISMPIPTFWPYQWPFPWIWRPLWSILKIPRLLVLVIQTCRQIPRPTRAAVVGSKRWQFLPTFYRNLIDWPCKCDQILACVMYIDRLGGHRCKPPCAAANASVDVRRCNTKRLCTVRNAFEPFLDKRRIRVVDVVDVVVSTWVGRKGMNARIWKMNDCDWCDNDRNTTGRCLRSFLYANDCRCKKMNEWGDSSDIGQAKPRLGLVCRSIFKCICRNNAKRKSKVLTKQTLGPDLNQHQVSKKVFGDETGSQFQSKDTANRHFSV